MARKKGGKRKSPDPKKKGSTTKKRKMMTLDKVKARRRKKRKKSKKKVRTYKVPSDEEIVDAIDAVMLRNHIVRSQIELLSLVKEELKARDPDFAVTGERVRKVSMEKAGLTIEIQSREKDTGRGKAMSKCPVCGSPIKAMKNVTIYGGTVTLGFKCTKCPYWTGSKRRVPTRYVFYKRKRR